MSSLLNKDEIIAVDDQQYEDVNVPEWGGDVRICVLSGTERDRWEQECINRTGPNNKIRIDKLKVGLLASCLVNGNRELLFTQKDLNELNSKNAAVIQRLFKDAQRINAIGDEAMDELSGN